MVLVQLRNIHNLFFDLQRIQTVGSYSLFGLTDGTSAPVIPVIELLAGPALPFYFFPLLRCGTTFHKALGEGSSPPKYPKAIRLQVVIEVLPGIPFFKNKKFIFILHTPAKVAA